MTLRYALLPTFLVLVLSPSVIAQTSDTHARVRVFTQDLDGGPDHLARLGLAVDHGEVRTGHHIVTDLSYREIGILQEHGVQHEILIDDVGAYYAQRNAIATGPRNGGQRNEVCGPVAEYDVPANFQLGSMGGFLTWQEMLDELDAMHAQYPGLITAKEPIGMSLEQRPIHVVRMSNAPNVEQGKPEVLYNALHHAREPASLSQLIYFMWHLLENYGTDPEATYLLDHLELYFVPCINPDGYVYNEAIAPDGGGMWRKNRRDNGDGTMGVDLNRNYGFGWGVDDSGSSSDGNSEVYRGTAPFSEPETQAIRDLCEARDFRLTLNTHTYGNLLIYPWGFQPSYYTPDSAVFVNYGQLLTRENNYQYGTADQTVNYVVNGGSDDWMYGEQGTKPKIFAMTPEAGEATDGFWPESDRIIDICKVSMAQNLYTAHLAGNFGWASDRAPSVVAVPEPFMPFALMRLGQEAGDLAVSLIPLENVIAASDPILFSGLDLLEERVDSISLVLVPDLPEGSTFRYILAVDNGNYVHHDTISKVFGNALVSFADDGSSLSNWQSSSWGVSSTTWFSPPSSITDSPNGNYPNNANHTITLNDPIDLGNATSAQLNFMTRWDIEAGYDFVQVMASDNGIVWTPLCGLYTKAGSVYQDEGEPVYDGRQLNWVQEHIDLGAFLGQEIRLRFRLISDNWSNRDGYYFDDLHVTITEDGSAGVVDQDIPSPGLQLQPNPALEYTWASWSRTDGTPGTLIIHDAMGSVVREIPFAGRQGSFKVETADLPAGIYHLVLEQKGAVTAAQRLVVVRH